MKINKNNLSVRAGNALINANIETVEDLLNYDWWNFTKLRSCGVKTVAELAQLLIRIFRDDLTDSTKGYEQAYKRWLSIEPTYREYRREIRKIQSILDNLLAIQKEKT